MKAFWRSNTQLTHNEEVILTKCLEAHREATFRQNASSEVIKLAYQCNGSDFLKAVMSGLGTLGGVHAPIEQTYDFLQDHAVMLTSWDASSMKERLPGWGSSFVKGKPDKIVENAMLYLDTGWPEMGKRIEVITDFFHYQGKLIYPNMACLTAATAIILGMPKELAPVLLIQGRAMAWAEIIYDAQRQSPETPLRDNGEGI